MKNKYLLVLLMAAGLLLWSGCRVESNALPTRTPTPTITPEPTSINLQSDGFNALPITTANAPLLEVVYQYNAGTHVMNAAFHADRSLLALALSSSQEVVVVDVTTSQVVQRLTGHANDVSQVAFSDDGNYLASMDEETIYIWDTATFEPVKILRHNFGESIQALIVSPDGRYVFSSSSWRWPPDGYLWEGTGDNREPIKQFGSVVDAAFSPDGNEIAVVDDNDGVSIWDIDHLEAPIYQDTWSRDVAYLPDGVHVALSHNNGVNIYQRTGLSVDAAPVQSVSTGYINDYMSAGPLAFGSQNDVFLTIQGGAGQSTARLWSMERNAPVFEFGRISNIHLNPDGKYILTWRHNWNNGVDIWAVREAAVTAYQVPQYQATATAVAVQVEQHRQQTEPITAANISQLAVEATTLLDATYDLFAAPNGTIIGGFDRATNTSTYWDAATGDELVYRNTSDADVRWLTLAEIEGGMAIFSPDSRWIAQVAPVSSSSCCLVYVYDLQAGELVASIDSDRFTSYQFLEDNRLAIVGNHDVQLWDFSNPDQPSQQMRAFPAATIGLFDRYAILFYQSDFDASEICLWDLIADQASGSCATGLPESNHAGQRIAIHDDRLVLLQPHTYPPLVVVWEMATGTANSYQLTDELNEFSIPEWAIAHDSIIMTEQETVLQWDYKTDTLTALGRHLDDVERIAASPDGALVATAGLDGNLKIWDVGTGTDIFSEHIGLQVIDVMFTPDGTRLIVISQLADDTRQMQIWSLQG